jgi:hypothetical protein
MIVMMSAINAMVVVVGEQPTAGMENMVIRPACWNPISINMLGCNFSATRQSLPMKAYPMCAAG